MSIKDIFESVISFNKVKVAALVKEEIAAGTEVTSILNKGLISAMDEVGKQFSQGNLFVPEMLRAAQTMKVGLEVLKPHLAAGDSKSSGTVIIGTVKGDLHDIGKNLVAMMLEGAGFEVIDLGIDVPAEKFVQVTKEKNGDILCLSALLTVTMPAMEETIKAVKEAGLTVRTMVGGAPVTQEFADSIGADGYTEDAAGAVQKARELFQAC